MILSYAQADTTFIPIASVYPLRSQDALLELERLAGLGVKIIKLHPNTQQFDVASTEVHKVVKKAGDLGLVLLFDSYSLLDANEIGKLLVLAVEYPNTKFIFAHLGGFNYYQFAAAPLMQEMMPNRMDNVWFDLSFISEIADSPRKNDIVYLIRKIGVDRFLFGSDFPLWTSSQAIAYIHKMGFSQQEQSLIFYENARKLLGL
jgi:predicted TIM-barrel fold metal-dependent hydrolase